MGTASETADRAVLSIASCESLRVVKATVGDHVAIEHFLCSVMRHVSTLDFYSQLEDPWYEPASRLLLKRYDKIIGHVRLHWREISFGSSQGPLCRLGDLCLLPEYSERGLAVELIQAAERAMCKQGVILGEADLQDFASAPHTDWLTCDSHIFSEAGPRHVLAELRIRKDASQTPSLLPIGGKRFRQVSVRPWRQMELPELIRLYENNTNGGFGYLQRSEAYWRWLVNRRAFDQIFVVVEGRDCFESEEKDCQIVGYAVVHAHQILEMMVEPGHPIAAEKLLARICADAIERDWRTVSLQAPYDEPMHRVIGAAGRFTPGRHKCAHWGAMLFVPAERQLVRCLGPELLDRKLSSVVPVPTELGWLVGNKQYRILFTGRGARLVAGDIGSDHLACSRNTWLRLLLGIVDARSAFTANKLTASTVAAREYAEVLFPLIPLWRSSWDDLPIG